MSARPLTGQQPRRSTRLPPKIPENNGLAMLQRQKSMDVASNIFVGTNVPDFSIKPASSSYKILFNEAENTDMYSIQYLAEKLRDDSFVRSLVEAEIAFLQHKIDLYKHLSEVSYDTGNTLASDAGPSLDNQIKEVMAGLENKYNKIISLSKAVIDNKRNILSTFINDPNRGLASITGESRAAVRSSIIKLILAFEKLPILYASSFLNIMMTGPAGSGKTKISFVIAHAFHALGVLLTPVVKVVTKQNLVGEYLGQSAPKTRLALVQSLEGVLFIDEAYTLTPCPNKSSNDNSYSEEAIGELINFLDKFKGCIVVIIAGYRDPMYRCFLEFNEGINRRFPKKIDLINYSDKDLFDLFLGFVKDTSISPHKLLSNSQQVLLSTWISKLNALGAFTNQAGDILNLSTIILEDALLKGKDYNEAAIQHSIETFLLMKDMQIVFAAQ